MATFEQKKINGKKTLLTKLKGRRLIQNPRLNKGSAFTKTERAKFDLVGLLPIRQESLLEQSQRIYKCYCKLETNLDKHVLLRHIRNQNEVLFYYLIKQNFAEMLPIIYTPTIGEAVEKFSEINLQPRGLFISYPELSNLKTILAPYKNYPIKIAIITDGEGVLGIGDQGAGGINIAIAKGSLYSLLGGLDPSEVLPIQIDSGTNNTKLRQDSNYLGWQHPRIKGKDYYNFVEKIVKTLLDYYPGCFIHWEDFARDNAQYFLRRYQDSFCTFNDDIQGTGAVSLATILTALKKNKKCLTKQNTIIYGAGSAGIGIANQICLGLEQLGLSSTEARSRIWLIDRHGLLCHDSELNKAQKPYAKSRPDWAKTQGDLLSTIINTKASILIGCSAQKGHFTKECIQAIHNNCQNPIIMPLSNPTECAEATPANIITWTNGKALIASGSPFKPVVFGQELFNISQCNNMFIFPGLGRAVTLCNAKTISSGMMMAACMALAKFTNSNTSGNQLLPNVEQCRDANKAVAKAVIKQAINEKLATREIQDIDAELTDSFWKPKYLKYMLKDEDHD